MTQNGRFISLLLITFIASGHNTFAMQKPKVSTNSSKNSQAIKDKAVSDSAFDTTMPLLKEELSKPIISRSAIHELIAQFKWIKKDNAPYSNFDPLTIIKGLSNRSLVIVPSDTVIRFIKNPCFHAFEQWCYSNQDDLILVMALIFYKTQTSIEDNSIIKSKIKSKILTTACDFFKYSYKIHSNSVLGKIAQNYLLSLYQEYPLIALEDKSLNPAVKKWLKETKSIKEFPNIPLFCSMEKTPVQKPTPAKKVETNPFEEVYRDLVKQKKYLDAIECGWQLFKQSNENLDLQKEIIQTLEQLSQHHVDALYYLVDCCQNQPDVAIQHFLNADILAFKDKKVYNQRAQNVALEALGKMETAGCNQICHVKATHDFYEFETLSDQKARFAKLANAYCWAIKKERSSEIPKGCMPLGEIENKIATEIFLNILRCPGKTPQDILENQKHKEECVTFWTQAITHECAIAHHNLANFLLLEFRTTGDVSEFNIAFNNLVAAIEKNVTQSAQLLEQICQKGICYGLPLLPAYRPKAFECLQQQTIYSSDFIVSIRQRVPATETLFSPDFYRSKTFQDALEYFDKKLYATSILILQELVLKDDWQAYLFLHQLHQLGMGVKESPRIAHDMLQAIIVKNLVAKTPCIQLFCLQLMESLSTKTARTQGLSSITKNS